MSQSCNCSNTYKYKQECVICGEEWNDAPVGCTYNPASGDFIAQRQMYEPVVVWNVNGDMCIALDDDPVYITKEQAMKFFGLTDNQGDSK